MYAVAVWKLKRLKKSGGFVRLFLSQKFKTFLIPSVYLDRTGRRVVTDLSPSNVRRWLSLDNLAHHLGLEGKVFIVPGGASGIGKAVVEELLSDGAKVSVCDMNPNAPTYENGEVLYIPTNVTSKESVDAMVAKTVETYGHLDGIVNNAGINIPRLLVDEPSIDRFLKMVDDPYNCLTLCTGSLNANPNNNCAEIIRKHCDQSLSAFPGYSFQKLLGKFYIQMMIFGIFGKTSCCFRMAIRIRNIRFNIENRCSIHQICTFYIKYRAVRLIQSYFFKLHTG